MAMKAKEIRGWLDLQIGRDADAEVGVDDSGLCLRVVGDDGNYCEVGGLPVKEHKATVKATGKTVFVEDHGPKMYPRYWDEAQGYEADELKFG